MNFLKALFVGCLCLTLAVTAFGKSVTVGTSGADFTSINAAINDVREANDPGGPDVITILDEGPFFESRVILNNIGGTTFTMQASPGVRPLVIIDTNADGALYIRPSDAPGQTEPSIVNISDLIIIPATGDAGTRPMSAVRVHTPGTPLANWEVNLSNILVTSNDGENRPVSSLDGLSIANPPGASAATIRNEGFKADSSNESFNYKLTMSDFKVAYTQGTFGIRGFLDGADRTQSYWLIGPGCLVNSVPSAGINVGGNINLTVFIEGSEEKPIIVANNGAQGLLITGSEVNGGLETIKWFAAVNNAQHGVSDNNYSGLPLTVENVTIANNGLSGDYQAYFISDISNRQTTFAGNVILAGNGVVDALRVANVFSTFTNYTGTVQVTNSAIVLEGPYTLNTAVFDGDGLNDNTPSNVTKTNVTGLDPMFLSLDTASPDFLKVDNTAFGVLGPAGGPLSGAGAYRGWSPVNEWDLY